jgi:hypothetical protein
MKGTVLIISLVIILFGFPVMAQRGAQRSFGAEESIKRPIKIPKVVLQILRQDERVQRCFRNGDEPQNGIASWFKASAIDLNNDGRADLVVKPENDCLFGANITPFWIFHNTGNSYELVLKTHTLGLDILRSRTNGFLNIRVEAASAVMIYGSEYRFDGKRYMPRRCWEQGIEEAQKTRGGTIRYYPCSDDLEKPY